MLAVQISYTFTCFECQKTEKITVPYQPGQVLPIPDPPEGWVICGDGVFCAEHELFLLVDGNKRYPLNLQSKNQPKLVK